MASDGLYLHFTSFTYNSLQSWIIIFVHWMLDLAATLDSEHLVLSFLNGKVFRWSLLEKRTDFFCEGRTLSERLRGETSALAMIHLSWRDQDCILSSGVRLSIPLPSIAKLQLLLSKPQGYGPHSLRSHDSYTQPWCVQGPNAQCSSSKAVIISHKNAPNMLHSWRVTTHQDNPIPSTPAVSTGVQGLAYFFVVLFLKIAP